MAAGISPIGNPSDKGSPSDGDDTSGGQSSEKQPSVQSHWIVRASDSNDFQYAPIAAEMLLRASQTDDIAARSTYLLSQKITAGHAALALDGEQLVGFGYLARWKDNTVSHSGMIVLEDYRKFGVFRELKSILMDIAEREFADCDLISLTCSPAVKKVNEQLGYTVTSLVALTDDPEFWKGCQGCKNFESVNKPGSNCEVNSLGTRCCCTAMRLYRHEE
ncbi:MAG: hypothetical protein KDD70_07465 [Bdellovibrionales bacterium]|nr:hypothetical protein [Bdellovibrionales bacterium]